MPTLRSDTTPWPPAMAASRGASQIAGRRVTLVRVLGHRTFDHGVDRRRQVGNERPCRRRRARHVRIDDRRLVLLLERDMAGEHLVEHAAGGVHVRAGVDALSLELFRGGVVERPDERAHPCAPWAARRLGEAEVGEVDLLAIALAREQDVGRLDVAVHESVRVRGIEGGGQLGQDPAGAGGTQPALGRDHGAQVGPLDIAHRDVQQTGCVADLVDRDHVRMLDRGRDLAFVLEAGAELGVVGELRRHDLQRDRARRPQLLGPVHDAHAATAGDALDHEVAELGTGAQLTGDRYPVDLSWADDGWVDLGAVIARFIHDGVAAISGGTLLRGLMAQERGIVLREVEHVRAPESRREAPAQGRRIVAVVTTCDLVKRGNGLGRCGKLIQDRCGEAVRERSAAVSGGVLLDEQH